MTMSTEAMMDWQEPTAAKAPPGAGREVFRTRVRETLPGGHVSLVALADMAQDAAARHAVSLGMGHDCVLPERAVWVLGRLRLLARAYPRLGDAVLVETWASGIERRAARRAFRFSTDAGGVIGLGTSSWSLFDLDARRPLGRVETIFERIPPPGPALLDFRKAGTGGGANVASVVISPRPAEIDLWGHVNNTHLIAWVLGGAAGSVDAPLAPLDFEVAFRAECRLTDRFELTVTADPEGTVRSRLRRQDGGIDVVRATATYDATARATDD
ncbi:MAG: acyl-ACP thioesterase domain-containing protein [Pseudomonadota bacterium]